MIRFQCEGCGKPLAVQDSRAGAVGTCPGCKGQFRVPGGRQAEEGSRQPRPSRHKPQPGQDPEDAFSFSRSGLRKGLAWFLFVHLFAFVLMVGSVIGVVVILKTEQMSFKTVQGVAYVGLVGVIAFCYFIMSLPNWRLFFFSTIPSSSRYVVTGDRLVRYSRADEVVEEVPFANIADVRLLTRRSVEDPEFTAKVLGIDLRNPDDRETTLDLQFCRWSRNMHRHDLVLIGDFFDAPLKAVFRTLKKRWQQWQETHPASAEDTYTPPGSRRRRRSAWYQKPLTYVFGGLGLCGLAGLVWLLSHLGRGKEGGNAAAPPSGPVAEQPPANTPASEPFGPRSLPGLVAYWPLDEAQGKAANDASGNGSLGRIHGGEWLQGVKGSAVRLDGKGDFVDLGSEPRLNFGAAAPFTLAGWVATESNGVICSFRRRSSIFPIIELSVRQGKLFGWVRDDTSGFGGAKVTGGTVNDGKWHHAVLLRQGDGTIELFLDGASQGRDKGKSSGGPITTDLRALGCDRFLMTTGKKPPGHLAGNFDEFCVYDRPLAPAEITTLAARKQ